MKKATNELEATTILGAVVPVRFPAATPTPSSGSDAVNGDEGMNCETVCEDN